MNKGELIVGLKMFGGRSKEEKKSPYYLKIDKMLADEVGVAFLAVASASSSLYKAKTPEETNRYKANLDKYLVKFDDVIKRLFVELKPLKTKNSSLYNKIESDINTIREDVSVPKGKDVMKYVKELGEVFIKIRDGIKVI